MIVVVGLGLDVEDVPLEFEPAGRLGDRELADPLSLDEHGQALTLVVEVLGLNL